MTAYHFGAHPAHGRCSHVHQGEERRKIRLESFFGISPRSSPVIDGRRIVLDQRKKFL